MGTNTLWRIVMRNKQKKRQRIIQIGVVVIVSIFLLSTVLSSMAMFF